MSQTQVQTKAYEKTFFTKLEARVKEVNSHLCIGLDPHLKELFPDCSESTITETKTEKERCDKAVSFCRKLIEETAPYAAAFKPNTAFFEALGPNYGIATLRRVIDSIPPFIPVLLDVKRGDIGSTAQAYAESCYEYNPTRGLGADGVTLSPLMGWDSVRPFITGKYRDRGVFVLCKTSNPGSNDILALNLANGKTVYEEIASLIGTWSQRAAQSELSLSLETEVPQRLGLVVGATDPVTLADVRKAAGQHVWILAPGVGAQGGNLERACKAGMNNENTCMLITVSRGISFATNMGTKAKELMELINAASHSSICSLIDLPFTCSSPSQNNNCFKIESYQKDFIEFIIHERVLMLGSFLLKSGRTSPYFLNASLFDSGKSLYRLGQAYSSSIMASKELTNENSEVLFDVIFGPAYKGISLGAVVCTALFEKYGIDVGFAYNRKEAKKHGEGGVMVGNRMENMRVLILDDVLTAGTAVNEAFTLLKSIGAVPVGVSIALDRVEKKSLDDPISAVQAVSRDLNIPVISIVSLPQLQLYLEKNRDCHGDMLKSISEYRTKYGA